MAAKKAAKNAVVAFKVEEELADMLNRLPNKSAFIRKAIVAQLDMVCPMCRGAGVLPKWLHDHYVHLLQRVTDQMCEECGTHGNVLPDPEALTETDRVRLEQFFSGGPFYCQPCYDKAPTCNSCNWHITPEQVKKHQRQVHRTQA
jgi:hypothetical protein